MHAPYSEQVVPVLRGQSKLVSMLSRQCSGRIHSAHCSRAAHLLQPPQLRSVQIACAQSVALARDRFAAFGNHEKRAPANHHFKIAAVLSVVGRRRRAHAIACVCGVLEVALRVAA